MTINGWYTPLSFAAVLSAAVWWPALTTQAQTSTSNNDLATQHFEQGVELYQEGSLDAALVEFERAYELVQNYRLLFNLAQLQAERHEYVKAISLFDQYLEEGGAEIPGQRYAWVREELRKLRRRVAELWVESNVQEADVYVNGNLVGQLPLEQRLLINAGICNIRLEKSGYRPAEQSIKVAGGEHARLSIPMQSQAQARVPPIGGDLQLPGEVSAETGPRDMTPFWISTASFAALGAATATFAILAVRRNKKLDTKLDSFEPNPKKVDEDRSAVRTYATLADGLGLATAVAGGLSLYFLLDPPHERMDPEHAHIDIVPQPTGASLVGAF